MLPSILALYPSTFCGIALVWLHQATKETRASWAIHALACASIISFEFMTGPWAFSSVYFRYAAIGLYFLIAVRSYRRINATQRRATKPKASGFVLSALILVLFSVLNIFAVGSKFEPAGAIDLAFPLKGGRYYVLQGGRNFITNPFHAMGGSRFSVDLTKLNIVGNRAKGIAPRDLNAYEIFGETLHSPCDGIVLTVRDGLQDNIPGEIDTEHSEGNFVVLECVGVRVLMAHLMQGSIRVAAGETVVSGQPLGKIGNSGNTSEPHLHLDAKRGETEVPLKFDGRWLSINSMVCA